MRLRELVGEPPTDGCPGNRRGNHAWKRWWTRADGGEERICWRCGLRQERRLPTESLMTATPMPPHPDNKSNPERCPTCGSSDPRTTGGGYRLTQGVCHDPFHRVPAPSPASPEEERVQDQPSWGYQEVRHHLAPALGMLRLRIKDGGGTITDEELEDRLAAALNRLDAEYAKASTHPPTDASPLPAESPEGWTIEVCGDCGGLIGWESSNGRVVCQGGVVCERTTRARVTVVRESAYQAQHDRAERAEQNRIEAERALTEEIPDDG